MRHAPDNTTEQTLDLGINAISSCVYQTSKCIATTCNKLTVTIGLVSFVCFAFETFDSDHDLPSKRPVASCVALHSCEICYIINGWSFLVFLVAADFVMILRVWAMYNRSRQILGALLASFSLEIIFTIVVTVIYSNPKTLRAVSVQILDFSVCVVPPSLLLWTKLAAIFQMTHGGLMCVLAIVEFVRQSLQMYHVTKQWQLNRYMRLLVRQGILYFFAFFLYSLIDLLGVSGKIPAGGWQPILLFILEVVPMYTLTPRLIISIRELYARDVLGARGGGVDSGFGLLSHGGTAVVFADVQQNEGLGDVEEIPMEGRMPLPE
ncbi:hypothetical protein OG21DRAFT_1525736 [Imleria badia]|nr:hypothetical protein OG21DRAFT_1525736 [Imleria badia]